MKTQFNLALKCLIYAPRSTDSCVLLQQMCQMLQILATQFNLLNFGLQNGLIGSSFWQEKEHATIAFVCDFERARTQREREREINFFAGRARKGGGKAL